MMVISNVYILLCDRQNNRKELKVISFRNSKESSVFLRQSPHYEVIELRRIIRRCNPKQQNDNMS